MLKLHYKASVSLILVFLVMGPGKLLAIEETIPDAEILYNEEIRIFNFSMESGVYQYESVFRVKRRIQVNTSFGLRQFNTLYIPTFEDLDYKMEITHIKATTIKHSGERIEISDKHIRETTLPANIPLLYGYSGKVKQLVFSHVNPGDIIEYEYEVKYTATSSYGFLSIQNTILVAQNVPIKKAHFRFLLGRGLDGLFYSSNGAVQFAKEKRNYFITIENIPAVKEEDYSSKSAESPYILYDIMNDDGGVYSSWEKYIKRSIDKAKNRDFFMMGKTVGDFNKMVRSKKLTSTEDKVRAIANEVERLYSNSKTRYLRSIHRSHMNLEDSKQILKMIESLDLQASILLLKNREDGKILKNYISASQFDYIVVKFKGNDGKFHYWEPVDPYGIIDQFPFYYMNNEALEIGFVDGKISYSWFHVPKMDYSQNVRSTTLEIQLIGENQPIVSNAQLQVHEKGQFAYFSKPDLRFEQDEGENKTFSLAIEDDISDWFYKTDIQNIDFDMNDEDELQYSVDYSYVIYNGVYQNKLEFNIRDFIPSLTFTNLNKNRTTLAYLGFSRQVEYNLNIELPESYFSFVRNEYLNQEKENDVASFSVKTGYEDNHLKMHISYSLKEDVLTPEQWKEYVEIMNDIQSFYYQKILFEM